MRDERWLEIMVDGAVMTLVAMVEHGAMAPDIVTLAWVIERARNWIASEPLQPGIPG